MTKKILILTNSDSGLYNFRRELIVKLIENNEVYLCLPKGEYTKYFKELGCKYISLTVNRHGINPLKEFQLLMIYKQLIVKIKPDIVFTYTIKPNVYGGMVCAKLNIPYVANITGLGIAVENGGIMQKITLFLYKRGLKKAQKVFFQNIENRNFMINKGIVSGKYDLLPGSGVNLDKYRVMEYPNEETIDFLFLSRIMKEKGIDQYLETAEYIREKYSQTRFHVCGDYEQDYKSKLEKLQERGVIIYHGRIHDVNRIYRVTSCTIHPTYYPEGMSNVLLESCACGRPIITTDKAGCREIVEDGKNGFVVAQKDSMDLIEKVEKFLALSWDERKTMGLEGRKKVEREFNRQIVVDKYLDEVRRVVTL